jgi:phosphatidylinositol alpha-mannosyltransferase
VVVPYDLADEGGVKRHAYHLAESLRRMGDAVVVAGPLSRPLELEHTRGFGGVVNVPANGGDNAMALLTPPWEVRQFMRSQCFDVVHIHEPLTPLLPYYALWFSRKAAHVCTFHMYSETVNRALMVASKLLARGVLGRFERGIAVSQPAAEYAAPIWRRPLSVIPNGVPTHTFSPVAQAVAQTNGPFRVLFVGNWRDPRKGLGYLLEAHARLLGDGLDVQLDVVGQGSQEPRETRGVRFHGPIREEATLADLYRRCELFVAPATGQEAFGIVLLEAMASGRALVCSDIRGYREVVDDAGARLVPPCDVAALTRAIRELAAQPAVRARMGERNRRRAESFGWDRIALQVREEYCQALDARRRLA